MTILISVAESQLPSRESDLHVQQLVSPMPAGTSLNDGSGRITNCI